MVAPTAEDTEPSTPPSRQWPERLPRVDLALGVVLTLATFVVHSVHYVLTAPFWPDEAWVAVSTRLPLSALPHVTSSTPLGFTVLERLVPFGGEQRMRLLPLAFAALGVAVAYLIGRSLPGPSPLFRRVAGTLTALAVLLARSALLRNDLKQYTADAFVTLLVIFLTLRVESSWSRRRLAVLGGALVPAFTVSAATLFVALAAFGSLFAVCLVRRAWPRLLEVTVAGAATFAVLGGMFLGLYKPHVTPSLSKFWRAYYLPWHQGLGRALSYLHHRGGEMAGYLGMGPLLLALALVIAGAVTFGRLGYPALALFAPVLVLEMIGLGAKYKYPLFDERTSHFLTVMFALYAAVGVIGLGTLLARWSVVASGVVAVVAAVSFVVNVHADLRAHSIPAQDVRTPTDYVAAHRRPGDVVLVNSAGVWGVSYYWPKGPVGWKAVDGVATNFVATLPDEPAVIFARSRHEQAVGAAVRAAVARARRVPGARIWLIRTHVAVSESQFFRDAIGAQPVTVVDVIPCSLVLLTPSPGAVHAEDPAAADC